MDLHIKFLATLQATAKFKTTICNEIKRAISSKSGVKSGNCISNNNCQGILIEEGSSAEIIANHIHSNSKANIAIGGHNTENTKILYNLIEKSKAEGIFCVEGGQGLEIQGNQISENSTGIIFVQSSGLVSKNKLCDNEGSGIYIAE
jgi:hypothetical protein